MAERFAGNSDQLVDRPAARRNKPDIVIRAMTGHGTNVNRHPRVMLIGLLVALAGCAKAEPERPAVVEPTPSTAPAATAAPATTTAPATSAQTAAPHAVPPGLHNLQRASDRIYSGSEPHGEEGFASLEKLGVKTVVSVDGAKPNLELAGQHGLRYVHIPIGYDGVPEEAGLSLVRMVREVDGPIYIHCHHGKHRGPAAAAVACIAAGDKNGKEALEILVRAGTSKDYAGLWRDVEAFTPPPTSTELPPLVEVAQVDSLAAAMATVDRAFDNLKLLREAKWTVPPDHPDLVPAQEALLLQEGLHEAGRNLDADYDKQFKSWLTAAESQAIELRTALQGGNLAAATEASKALEAGCKQCHTKYRDQ